ncbi:NYN domain-containing protein [Chloroflexota bacterium]
MADRVMIFIDGSNLYHSLKHHFGHTDLDIGKFCRKLLGPRQLVRIYYYNATVGQKEEPERYKHQQAFFTSVNAIPYSELRLGRLVYNNWPSTPPYEKGIDVQLATDMITHNFKNNYDVGILVAGDNDYVGAVQAVKDNGKHIEVSLFGKQGTSRQLREAADRVVTINSRFIKGCWK